MLKEEEQFPLEIILMQRDIMLFRQVHKLMQKEIILLHMEKVLMLSVEEELID